MSNDLDGGQAAGGNQLIERRLPTRLGLLAEQDRDQRTRIAQVANIRAQRFALNITGLSDGALRGVVEPFIERTVQKQVREGGHRGNRKKANGDEINQQASLDLRAEFAFAAFATQLQKTANENERKDDESDKVKRRQSVQDECIRCGVRLNYIPKPELLRGKYREKQDHNSTKDPRYPASAAHMPRWCFNC